MHYKSFHDAFLSRRGVLTAGAGAAAFGLADPFAPATAANSLDYSDARDNVYAFAKMWGTFADKPVFSSFHGILFAYIGTKRLQPLFGFTGFGNKQCKLMDNGHVRIRSKEVGYHYDLVTGDILRSWDNPFTGERVAVFDFINERVRGELSFEMPRFAMGAATDEPTIMNEATAVKGDDGTVPFILPFEIYGSRVLLAWDYRHAYTNPVTPDGWPKASTGVRVNPSEHFTYFIPKEELEDRDLPAARYHAGFSRISPWWPWMKMGGHQLQNGVMFGRMFSYKEDLEGFGNMPPKVLAYAEKHYPHMLEPCDDWDTEVSVIGTWESYAEKVPPEVAGYKVDKT